MTTNELKKYNGKNGQKAYVAYKGNIYDVTKSDLWQQGEHEDMHIAGEDLTSSMDAAPHGDEIFSGFEIVDKLEKSEDDEKLSLRKERLKKWYKTYHPHPITVHFPIALHVFAGLFNFLFLFNKDEVYEEMVFYSLTIATVMGLVAMVFGILSWWVNYDFSKGKSFVIKFYVSILTLVLGLIGMAIYLFARSSIYDMDALGLFYHFIVFSTVFTVIVLGYYGGKITWSEPREKLTQKEHKQEAKKEQKETTQLQSKMQNFQDVPALKNSFEIEPYLKEDGTFKIEKNFQELNIQIAGSAGAGLNALATLITKTLSNEKLYHFITSEYMSRVRGGSNTTFIRIAEEPIESAKWEADILIALDKDAYHHCKQRVSNALVISDKKLEEKIKNHLALDIKEKVKDIGKIYANTYLFGVFTTLLNLPKESAIKAIEEIFKDKNLEKNIQAFKRGLKDGYVHVDVSLFAKNLKSHERFINGTQASGIGFLSGGINFVSSYPMSPSTGVFSFMAQNASKFKVVVEQSEDEIAGFNMMLGAWYSGAKGLTTTSGGGFALMSESMSLSGMSETPALVYLAQRPGPATGLPTRTEQGDLNLALYAGHGEFARALLAPGDSDEAIKLAHLSTHLADYFQIPVVYLSDQFFADSIRLSGEFDFSKVTASNYIKKTQKDYQRYTFSENGLTPRGIPAFGEGIICVTSDEHDQRGQITEDYKVREKMVEKREAKLQHLKEYAMAPKITKNGKTALLGWGSTKGVLKEVSTRLGLSHIHFSWIYPLKKEHLEGLKEFDTIIIVENNSDGQFAELLKKEGFSTEHSILNANGFAFFADSLEQKVKEYLKGLQS